MEPCVRFSNTPTISIARNYRRSTDKIVGKYEYIYTMTVSSIQITTGAIT